MKKPELIKFIESHNNWEEILQEEPYNLKIARDNGFIIFNYGINANFSIPLVREARGIIFVEKTWKVAAYAFDKFFNITDDFAPEINWKTAKILEKIDGSLIKVWNYEGEWKISTNRGIDAKKVDLYPMPTEKIKTFYELFKKASEDKLDYALLDSDNTYVFELISPHIKQVVPYQKNDIIHIGTRNNVTLEEIDLNIGIEKPKEYKFNSCEEMIRAVKKLPYNEEGYVVVDDNYNRVKVKSPAYIKAANLKNNSVITNKRILNMILNDNLNEFLLYFPEYEKRINEFLEVHNAFFADICADLDKVKKLKTLSRKDFARWGKKTTLPCITFAYYSGLFKKENVVEYTYEHVLNTTLLKYIEKKMLS
ncbi:MAG: RNA ligase [bacterium]